ncbi:MAG: type I restriction endonuclease subunit R [Anaerolineae bacterium]
MGAEYDLVEAPFLRQLQTLGWTTLEGDTDVPYLTERESFKDVLLKSRLRDALRRINLDKAPPGGGVGQPWLEEAHLDQAVGILERLGQHGLIPNNKAATHLLLKGTVLEGPDGEPRTVQYIDFEHPERNDFLAINQFRVWPQWGTDQRGSIIPDIVLFVNGIPLVVIEAKSPNLENPLNEAITQLLRYSNQREDATPGGVDAPVGTGVEPEGAEQLFHYAQLTIATCMETARLGTVGAGYRHYLEWKDPYPSTPAQVAQGLGLAEDDLAKGALKSQHILVAGMLRPELLLDIVRCFTLFTEVDGREVKIVPRYQQLRAVYKAIERLQTGKTKAEDGEFDRRSGIIWHTQGSGKSLSMVFLVRKMRTLPVLQRFKIVVVTDRTKLEKQLADTATLTGEPLQRAKSVNKLEALLREPGAGLVFGMIQKAQDRSQRRRAPGKTETWGLLNPSEEILLLVDEAHRSHTNTLHANLEEALPHCAMIGFTGTPIFEEDKKPTHEIFGPFIDTYTLRESQDDGATVPILYEGRKMPGDVAQREHLDAVFQETFWEYTEEEREAIKRKYATTGDVLEAEKLIAAKARDMLRHYVTTVMPNGFKAQIAGVSRLAAARYQAALEDALPDLVAELEALAAAPVEVQRASALAAALPHLERVRRLRFVAVVSGSHNDKPIIKRWTSAHQQELDVEDFKKPFDPVKGEGFTAMIAVQGMLLTGFDAPVEQALYIDRLMQGYELLQAIARVNRTYTHKEAGLVVDYYGLARYVKEALDVYTVGERRGAFRSILEQLPKLEARYRRVLGLFAGLDIHDTDACVHLLRDARLRAQFTVALGDFLQTLDTVLPRPQALPYVDDARQLGLIRTLARNRYRDEQLNIAGAEAKVRRLIDEHVIGQGIDPTIPPIDILAAEFEKHVGTLPSPRAQAAEMEFAIRHHISQRYQEDPVYYRKLSERLEDILQRFADNWQAQVEALKTLLRQHTTTQAEVSREEKRMQPFLRLLREASPVQDHERLAHATVELVNALIRPEVQRVDFWRNRAAQAELRSRVAQYLDDRGLVPYDQVKALADQIVQTAKANHMLLVA